LQGFANPFDSQVYSPITALIVHPPQMLDQLLARECPVGVLCQEQQQRQILGMKLQIDAMQGHAMRFEIDFDP